jgi:SAM-dependent methyltransferase
VNEQESIRQWYKDYYDKRGSLRNDLRGNSGVLFQTLACEACVVRASRDIAHDPKTALVLDVGCGGGGDLFQLLRLGYVPENVTGIDILTERIAQAKLLYPQVRFLSGDASRMEFADDTFDLIFESTMFSTLPDDVLAAGIAREMMRVCKPGGYLLLVDWRTPKPRDSSYKALTRKRLNALFPLGTAARLVGRHKGALIPPLGRFLSARLPSAYFAVAAIFPFLVGQVAYILKRNS